MRFISHIEHAIDSANRRDFDDALLHATIALDKASQLWANASASNNVRYKKFIREYHLLIEYFADLPKETISRQLPVIIDGKERQADLADLIYHYYRCSLCHGDEIPINYKLVPQAGFMITSEDNAVIGLPESIVWGLLAAAVFSKNSKPLIDNTSYELSYTPMQIVGYHVLECEGRKVIIRLVKQTGERMVFPIMEFIGGEHLVKDAIMSSPESIGHSSMEYFEANTPVVFATIMI